MYLLWTSVILTIPMFIQDRQPVPTETGGKLPTIKLDGDWTVVHVEMDGKKLDNKGFTQVTIKDNIVTCLHDGKEKSWRLQFGPHHFVRCTEMSGGKPATDVAKDLGDPTDKTYHTHHGVYVASQDYFCLALHKGRDRRAFNPTERRDGDQGKTPADQGKPQPDMMQRFGEFGPHVDHFVLILHRSGSPK